MQGTLCTHLKISQDSDRQYKEEFANNLLLDNPFLLLLSKCMISSHDLTSLPLLPEVQT